MRPLCNPVHPTCGPVVHQEQVAARGCHAAAPRDPGGRAAAAKTPFLQEAARQAAARDQRATHSDDPIQAPALRRLLPRPGGHLM